MCIISPDICNTSKEGEFCLGKKGMVLGEGGTCITSSTNKSDCNEVACGLSNLLVRPLVLVYIEILIYPSQ